MLYELRPHQEQMFNLVRNSFRMGLTRPIVYAATGWGKTCLAAHIVAGALDKGRTVCFIAPYISLINQTSRSFIAQGLPKAGIIQADHPDTDPKARLQIASVQTLSRRNVKLFDLYIVDECDLLYQFVKDLMTNTDKPIIGMTATPFRDGLGKYYNNLLSSITNRELMDQGYLCDYSAWSSGKVDTKKIKTNSEGDFESSGSAELMSKPKIMGKVVDTWLKLGSGEPTLCFACNVAHANYLGSEFDKIGISNKVITSKTTLDEREEAYEKFDTKEILILISCMVLVAGLDKAVFNLIIARPIKSDRVFMQIFGRGWRVNEGKDRLKVFDHGGNFQRLGRPEDIRVYDLKEHDDKKQNSVPKKNKVEAKPKECCCGFLKDAGVAKCESCGSIARHTENVIETNCNLKRIKSNLEKTSNNLKKYHNNLSKEKSFFLAELKLYQQEMKFKGKIYSDGYISHLYKSKYGEWPTMTNQLKNVELTEATRGYIKSRQIAYAKRMVKK